MDPAYARAFGGSGLSGSSSRAPASASAAGAPGPPWPEDRGGYQRDRRGGRSRSRSRERGVSGANLTALSERRSEGADAWRDGDGRRDGVDGGARRDGVADARRDGVTDARRDGGDGRAGGAAAARSLASILPASLRDEVGNAAAAIHRERERERLRASAQAAEEAREREHERERRAQAAEAERERERRVQAAEAERERLAAASAAAARALVPPRRPSDAGAVAGPLVPPVMRPVDARVAAAAAAAAALAAAAAARAQPSAAAVGPLQPPAAASPAPPSASPSASPSSSASGPPAWDSFLRGCRSVSCYIPVGKIDEGTYGEVFAATDARSGARFALKKVKMGAVSANEGFPITALRETNLLLSLGRPQPHPNIVSVREMVVGSSLDKVYMVMEMMEHDLKAALGAMRGALSQAEVKCLLQQLLAGVAHLHARWVIHRDLKPSNLLLDNAGRLVICDFGMARSYGQPLRSYTQPVVTLWYRAPELLLGATHYGPPVDVFACGAIFAELLTRRPLFRTASGAEGEMLGLVFALLGTPTEESWPGWASLPAAQGLRFKPRPPASLRGALGLAGGAGGGFGGGATTAISDAGLDLLRGMLTLDPAQRISAAEALSHRWFAESPPPCDPRLMPSLPSTADCKVAKNTARGGAGAGGASPPLPMREAE